MKASFSRQKRPRGNNLREREREKDGRSTLFQAIFLIVSLRPATKKKGGRRRRRRRRRRREEEEEEEEEEVEEEEEEEEEEEGQFWRREDLQPPPPPAFQKSSSFLGSSGQVSSKTPLRDKTQSFL